MTTFTIKLEDGVAEAVRRRAAERGTAAEDVVAQTVSERFHLDEVLRPVREAFEASGMTEDEAAELFEAEREAMHRERREAARPNAADVTLRKSA
jgi:hypothetical protein